MSIIFITGIDTGVGKTYAAGLLARFFYRQGKSVITQKVAQTGCEKISEDIEIHRKIMGIEYNEDDMKGLTCPYIFKFPASPHLSAQLEKSIIDIDIITKATRELSGKYEYVLLEGVGGIYVPLNEKITLLDYIEEQKYPIIIVSSSRLGSINHTLLTMETIKKRNLDIQGIIYNRYPEQSIEIVEDSKKIFNKFLLEMGFNAPITDIPVFDIDSVPDVDFYEFFKD